MQYQNLIMKKKKFPLIEVGFKFVLLSLFGTLYVMAIPYPTKSREFPQLIAAFGLLIVMISLARDFIQKKTMVKELGDVEDAELTAFDEENRKIRRKRFYQAWAILLVSTFIGFLFGFLFTTFFLFFGFSILFGKRKNFLKNTMISLAISLMIFFIFQWLMDIPLMQGVIKIKFLR
jgi:hypothetical protein